MITAIVAAGGRSRRMGCNKALIPIGGKPIIERVIEVVSTVADEILVVASDLESYRHLDVRVHADLLPDRGPLGALHTGLTATHADAALLVACDMPLLNAALLAWLGSRLGACDAVVPRARDGTHPLHAIYARRCLPVINRLLQKGPVAMRELEIRVTTRYVDEGELRLLDPDLRSLVNVNTPADRELTESLLGGCRA